MSDYAIAYSLEAFDDLRKIYSYIAFSLLEPANAKKQVDRIRRKIRSLGFMPSKFERVSCEPWKSMGMHRAPIDNFIIFYIIDETTKSVSIVRVFYGGRDIENLMKATSD